MAMFTLSVLINRSQQDVFDSLSNPMNLQQATALMQSAACTSGGELGLRSTGRGIMQIVGPETLLNVTQWDPPHRYGIKVLNEQFPLESTEYVYTLEPEEGGTRVTLDVGSEWTGLNSAFLSTVHRASS